MLQRLKVRMHETRQIVRGISSQVAMPKHSSPEWKAAYGEVGSLHCFSVYRQRNCEVVGPTVVELRLEWISRAIGSGHVDNGKLSSCSYWVQIPRKARFVCVRKIC